MMVVESQPECKVSGALAFALRMSRIAGVAPIKFRRVRGGWRVRVSHDIQVYGQTIAVILCLLTISVLLTDILVEPHRSVRMDTNEDYASTFADFVMMSLVTLGGAFTGIQRMSAMIDSLNQIQKITLQLNYYRQGRTIEKKKWMILIVTVFGGFAAILFDYVLSLYESIQKHGKLLVGAAYIFHDLLLAMQVLLEVQFVLITLTISTALDQLDGCLEDLLDAIKSDDVRKSSSKLSPEAVHHFSYLQGCVCEAVRQVDASHGVVVLLVISSSMFHLLLTLYNIVDSYLAIKVLNNFRYNPTRLVIWATVHFCRLFAVVEPCHRTQEAMQKTKELVSQLTLRSSRGALATELALFFRHLYLNDTAYSPMNMFTLNRQLVVTILATITTYLVIVEQL